MSEDSAGMRVIRGATELPQPLPSSIVTIGNFDGVHLAHRELLRRVVDSARRSNAPAVVVTFEPHPAQVLFPGRVPKALSPLESKLRLIENCGVDLLWAIPFTQELARISATQFVQLFLVSQLNATEVHVGVNFSFGNKRLGNVELLVRLGREYGFRVEALPLFSVRAQRVSSSRIRELISLGRIELANRLLGRPFAVEGQIVAGEGIGGAQTVPTLNLSPVVQQLPAAGVYVTRSWLSGRPHDCVTNVGRKPTFGPHPLTIETYLLNSPGRVLTSPMRIEFLYRLRNEKKFPDASVLKAQIHADVRRSLKYFKLTSRLVHTPAGRTGSRTGAA